MTIEGTMSTSRPGRVIRAFVAIGIALMVALFQLPETDAAEVRRGDTVRIADGTTVNEDAYLFGGRAEIVGTAERDVFVSAGEVEVTARGRITGSLNAAAGRIKVRGPIGQAVRVTGGELTVFSTVGGDVVVVGGTVTIAKGATVRGDVVVAGGEVDILGTVEGDVRGNTDDLFIDARVGGDVRVNVDRLRLGSAARIAGALSYGSRRDATIAQGAIVSGPTDRHEPNRLLPGDNVVVWLGSAILRLLWGLIAGVVIILVMPVTAVAIAEGARNRLIRAFLLGLLLLILLPVALALLLITVIGIPIAAIGVAFYLAGLYLSQVFVGLALGRWMLPNSWGDEGRGFNLLAMTLGVIILAGLRLIPLPYLGTAVATLTGILGLGALVIGMRPVRQRPAPTFGATA